MEKNNASVRVSGKRYALLLALAAMLLAGRASGVEYVDIEKPDKLITPGIFGGYIGFFDIVSPGSSTYTISGYSQGNGTYSDYGGYTKGTDLLSATASFYFTDDNDSAIEKVDVYIGLFDGEWSEPLENYGATTISFGASSISLALIEKFGGIEYVVKSDRGDFKLKYAMLTAKTVPKPNGVPDGGSTLILLGSAILGIVGIKSRVATAT